MLVRTHILFTAACLAVLTYGLGGQSLLILATLPISFLVNHVVDAFGHSRRRWKNRLYVSRTPLTHTPTHSVITGALASAPVAAAFAYYGLYIQAILTFALGGLAGLTHIFLDAFTEAGIYVNRNGSYRRAALAHLAYNNAPVNAAVSFISLLVVAPILIHAAQPILTHLAGF